MEIDPELTERRHGDIHTFEDEAARAAGLLVAFTDRRGGVGEPPFDSLNLAMTVGDDLDAVGRNRKEVASALGFGVDRLALARQVHGAELIEVRGGCSGVIGEADVLATSERSQVVAILTADCTPVVVTGRRGVAIAHAGWRGLVAGAIDAAVEWVDGANAAWVGPCIRACCYEVGREVIDAFESKDLPVADGNHVDPRDASIASLQKAGVARIAATDACTHCDPNFFSFRRDGVTGRQGAFVALLP
jgi:YfiH family protein